MRSRHPLAIASSQSVASSARRLARSQSFPLPLARQAQMATPDFGSREFWEANALAPKDEYVEWFAGYAELANVLRCACSPGSTVLHAGCGISSLSQALYDDGFLHQVAVDFSEQCMLKQRELCGPSRPEMGNAVMDCTKLGLRPASVDVCIVGVLGLSRCAPTARLAAAHGGPRPPSPPPPRRCPRPCTAARPGCPCPCRHPRSPSAVPAECSP